MALSGVLSSRLAGLCQCVSMFAQASAPCVPVRSMTMRSTLPMLLNPPPRPKKESEPERVLYKNRNIRGSLQRLTQVANFVHGMKVSEALDQLAFSPKRIATDVSRVVANAAATAAHNFQMDKDNLYIAKAWTGRGKHLDRIRFHGRGRGGYVEKQYSHLFVEIQEGALPEKKRLTRTARWAKRIEEHRKPKVIRNSL
eukprot:comp18912_c0_seq1/m.21081 comp18912_c0_seq1/g.21081  ORF comp18912_c0_seq1/g.21081 comp18912_c0_seq1/m.21081 type:complete len:198 (-) comp18912_c0_seq1:169-762(-)